MSSSPSTSTPPGKEFADSCQVEIDSIARKLIRDVRENTLAEAEKAIDVRLGYLCRAIVMESLNAMMEILNDEQPLDENLIEALASTVYLFAFGARPVSR